METDGVLSTESHSVWHRNLTTLTPEELSSELIDSRAAIEAIIDAEGTE